MSRQEDCKVKPCAGKFKNANSGTAEIRQEEGSTSQEGGGTPRTRHTGPREYSTGFHKRKVERKKAAIEEIKQRLKQEQKKLREERHQEYSKMSAEREEASEEADESERLVTVKTESVQYDHPNHTVTVTTISDSDLSGARSLGSPSPEQGDQDGSQEEEMSSSEKPTKALPRKSKDPSLSQRISSLTATSHAHSRKKVKRKHPRRAQDSTKKPPSATRTSKTQRRRRMTGKARHNGE